MHGERETLTVSEAAEQLGVAEKTVRRWVKSGRLAATLRAGPYGPQYVIDAGALTAARQALAVATVERRADPRTLALAIVQALEPRDAALKAELADLRREVAALAGLVAQRLPADAPQRPVEGRQAAEQPDPPSEPDPAPEPVPGPLPPTPDGGAPWWRRACGWLAG